MIKSIESMTRIALPGKKGFVVFGEEASIYMNIIRYLDEEGIGYTTRPDKYLIIEVYVDDLKPHQLEHIERLGACKYIGEVENEEVNL